MIWYLKWIIKELNFNSVLILTQWGVWYDVWINEKIYDEIISNNTVNFDKQIELFVYHHISENTQSLFGFLNKSEKKIFMELIKISWIWWKVAMQILSLWIDNLIAAVWIWDNKMIQSVKWIGKKMAEKIIIELKDKDFWIELNTINATKENLKVLDISKFEPIKQTLKNMWYIWKDIDKVLQKLPEDITDTGEILWWVIKELS